MEATEQLADKTHELLRELMTRLVISLGDTMPAHMTIGRSNDAKFAKEWQEFCADMASGSVEGFGKHFGIVQATMDEPGGQTVTLAIGARTGMGQAVLTALFMFTPLKKLLQKQLMPKGNPDGAAHP